MKISKICSMWIRESREKAQEIKRQIEEDLS